MKIQTVLGQIDVEDLGVTMAHDHLITGLPPYPSEDPRHKEILNAAVTPMNRDDILRAPYASIKNQFLDEPEVTINELSYYTKLGGKSIIDPLPGNCGRDPILTEYISRKTGVNVIASTGVYYAAYESHSMKESEIEEVKTYFLKEIQEGMDETQIKAGMIKIGIQTVPVQVSHKEEIALRAAAQTNLETGTKITVHTFGNSKEEYQGPRVVDILEDEGVNPNNIQMAHMDWTLDWDYVSSMMERGVYVGFDCFGLEWPFAQEIYGLEKGLRTPTDIERADGVRELIESGFLKNILLGHDICMKIQLKKYGGHGYAHILRNVVPLMQSMSIIQGEIDTMLIQNPQKYLSN